MIKLVLAFTLSMISVASVFAQTEATAFTNYKANPKTSVLPDFSYAGYQNGEKTIDYSAKNLPVYNVTNYGAIANDGVSDKAAIKATISAALTGSAGGIIFFPPGEFIIQDATDDQTIYNINKSNIIFKGSGSGAGGTRLFMKTPMDPSNPTLFYSCASLFIFGSGNAPTLPRAATANAAIGDFDVSLANTSDLAVGNWLIFEMRSTDAASLTLDLGSYPVDPTWTSLNNGGVDVSFCLQIKSIVGNTVTLKQPLPYPINASLPWTVSLLKYTEEMGIEDIAFAGNFQQAFVHHRSALDDSGYSMIQFKRVVNSWMRNCTFKDVSVASSIGVSGANITIDNCTISGNGGHEAINNAAATNVLLSNITDLAGQWHSVGVSSSAMNTVLYNVTYPSTTSFETHSSQPRNTLLDNVTGGLLDGRGGGDVVNMPNHMRNLVLWNYEKTNTDFSNFRFWPNTTYWKVPFPILVGFHGQPTTFTSSELKYQESNGTAVFPKSLYYAQLQLRLANAAAGYGAWSAQQNTYDYNLGSNTRTSTTLTTGSSETTFGFPAIPGFLPTPPSGVVKAQVNGSTGGNGFTINNPTDPATASVTLTANSASATNKLSAYNIDNSTEIASMFFNINFNNVATNGTYVWALGNKNATSSLFTSSSSVYAANTESFTVFEWTINASSIDFKFRESANATSSVKQLINSTTFTRGGSHAVEVYANNSTVIQTYVRTGTTYSVPAGKFQLWINNLPISYNGSPNFSKSVNTVSTAAAELADNLTLNAYLFHANNSTLPSSNAATATISKIKLNYSATNVPLSVVEGNWVNELPSPWTYDFTPGTSGTLTTQAAYNATTLATPFLPAPPSGVAQLWIPTSASPSSSFVLNAQNNNLTMISGASGTTKFSAFTIANATEIAAQTFTLNFGKTGANPIKSGTTFVWSMGYRGSLGTIYSNSNSVFTAANSFSNGVGNLFNAIVFAYNTTANAYIVSSRTLGNTTGTYAGIDGGDLSVDVPYKFEIYCNNSGVSKAYKRGSITYNVAAGSYHLWISNLNTNTVARYSVKGTLNYDIPRSVETGTGLADGSYSIPVNTPLNAFLFNGNGGADNSGKLTINGGLKIAYNASILPVSLISFTGKKETNGIRLNWKTASELNNDYFELLHSSEALNFSSLTKVAGKETSNQLNTYSYLDNAPETGTNYYKLKQVDKDGTASVSDIVVAVNNGLNDEEAFYLQFVGANELKAQFNAENSGSASVSIYGLSGKAVFNKAFATEKGLNNISLQTPSLIKGVYIFTLTQGGKSKSIKIVK